MSRSAASSISCAAPLERLWFPRADDRAVLRLLGRLTRTGGAHSCAGRLRAEESQIAGVRTTRRNVSPRLASGGFGPALVAFHEELFEGDAVRGICENIGKWTICRLPGSRSCIADRRSTIYPANSAVARQVTGSRRNTTSLPGQWADAPFLAELKGRGGRNTWTA